MNQKVKTLIGLGVIGAVLAIATLAWACTTQPLYTMIPRRGEPGVPITISGDALTVTGKTAVEVRWNSLKGKTVASTSTVSSSFSVTFPVPDEAPGVYFIVVAAPQDSGVARLAFEVLPPPIGPGNKASAGQASASKVSTDLWAGYETASSHLSANPVAVEDPGSQRSLLALGIGLSGVGAVGVSILAVTAARRRKAIRS